ncbi:S41 family peptidase [Salegentibacter sp. F188]|uniref:S41 family peptidase n=1 Tax=Autumnicola patrickiae TaxID=3075591 RepID=A0ABU3E2M0_9FLAO|nr:S41 family peptidase [Salegentibacter sp. F188]MDT0690248.1 S41 family peptidase [Salegentibacter sp. F188]
MKFNKWLLFFIFTGTMLTSCSEDENDEIDDSVTENPENLDIEKFIYRGMNEYYLYKSDVPELANDHFANRTERDEFLTDFETPEDLFYDGLLAPQDRFSYITDDYIALENNFSGIATTTGVDFRLYRFSNSDDLFGVVRYIIPESNADGQNIKRGDLFTRVNGETLTIDNYSALLSSDEVIYHLASIEDNVISETSETVTLVNEELTENPVLITKTLDVEGMSVGYIMYNSFVADFDADLNAAFSQLAAEGITKLILDLRYNGGGRVSSATRMASMITGQFKDEIFAKEKWNGELQNLLETSYPDRLYNRFTDTIDGGESITSLNLNDLYVITSSSSASASELIINGLDPYIEVQKVGDTTTGKSQASVTLYDSPNFNRVNANPDHTYAIQPLVLESVNSMDVSVPVNGIIPDVAIEENIWNLGVLGEPSDPLLSATLDLITGNRRFYPERKHNFKEFSESGHNRLDYQRMYIDEVPPSLAKQLFID